MKWIKQFINKTIKLNYMNLSNKGDILILKIDNKIIEVIFSHWVNKNGNGIYFYDTIGIKYSIKNII
jgi:NurA-like 5'-3' nuclease